MKKLVLLSSVLLVLALGFSFSPVLAADGAMESAGNTIKNAADGAKNVVEGAISGTENVVSKGASGIKNATSDMENTAQTTTDNAYTATRTSANTSTKIAGMTAKTWTWLIMGILGALIVALVYYYAKQDHSVAAKSIDE